MSDPAWEPPFAGVVELAIPPWGLGATLAVPDGARGIVLFAHGSGSSRSSPRNRFVATGLQAAGFGTLLFDLLTAPEEAERRNVFNIALLAGRLVHATRWLAGRPERAGRPLAYFGASTGAAAALVASVTVGPVVGAVVSRGGRPDLAGEALAHVTAPTLLIVGGEDQRVLPLNRDAAAHLRSVHELRVIPGATHLFEEPGALEAVTTLAAAWFTRHLVPPVVE